MLLTSYSFSRSSDIPNDDESSEGAGLKGGQSGQPPGPPTEYDPPPLECIYQYFTVKFENLAKAVTVNIVVKSVLASPGKMYLT